MYSKLFIFYNSLSYKYKVISFILLGLTTSFSFPPYSYSIIIFFTYILLFIYIHREIKIKSVLISSYIFTFSFFLFSLNWLFTIEMNESVETRITVYILFFIIIILSSIYLPLAVLLFKTISKPYEKNFFIMVIIFSSLLTLFDWLRSFILTGFPIYYPSDTLLEFLDGMYPVGGRLLVNFTFYIILNTIIYISVTRNKLLPSFFILTIIYLNYYLNKYEYTKDLKQNSFNVHIINSRFNKSDKSSLSKTIHRVNNFYQYSLFNNSKADLILWPESTLSNLELIKSDIKIYINKLTKYNNTQLFTGAYIKIDDHEYNSIINFSNENNYKVSYVKKHLIPLAEYTPSFFKLIKPLLPDIYMDNLSNIYENKTFKFNDLKISASICYEIFFPEEQKRYIKDSNLLMNISDLGWLNNTLIKNYFLELAKIRSKETEKPMLYSVNKGLSALINKKGEVIKSAVNDSIIVGKVVPTIGNTPYGKYGNSVVFLLMFTLIILFFNLRGENEKNR